MLKVIELFAGIGSQTQALKNIGIEHEVIAISDNDEQADKSYRILHNSNVNNLGDITQIRSLPRADLWTYSFPCQDISVAGLQRGLEQGSGTRSGLLWEVERLLNQAKEDGTLPKYLLLENVKNLLGKNFKDSYEKWLSFLSSLGYTTYTQVLNAKDYGIPQNRERVFGVSILGEHEPFVFPEKQPLKLRLKDMLEEKVDERYYLKASTIISILNTTFNQRLGLLHGENDICATLCARDFHEPKLIAVGKLEGGVWDKRYNQIRQVFNPDGISPTIMAGGGGGTETKIIAIRGREGRQVIEPGEKDTTHALTTVTKDNLVVEQKAVSRNYKAFIEKEGYIPELFNPWNKKEITDISPTQTVNCGANFASATVLKAELTNPTLYVKDANKKGYAELQEGDSVNLAFPQSSTRRGRVGKKVAQTLDTQCNQATMEVGDYLRIRKLTPKECWRLMGWKDEQIDKVLASGISNTQMYKQAGNGIVINVLEAIFKNLLKNPGL